MVRKRHAAIRRPVSAKMRCEPSWGYDYPVKIRELRNIVEHAVILSSRGVAHDHRGFGVDRRPESDSFYRED